MWTEGERGRRGGRGGDGRERRKEEPVDTVEIHVHVHIGENLHRPEKSKTYIYVD